MKRKNKKIIIIAAIIILLAIFIYEIKIAGDVKIKNNINEDKQGIKINDNDSLMNWKIPEDEILVDLLNEDTNQDGLKEILVITEKPEKKSAYFYIFNDQGEKIYYKESGLLPDQIELRKFEDDNYDSFFLVFEGQFKEGFFIRWNGERYVISEE